MTETHLITGPYTHAPLTISQTMFGVVLALTPALLFGITQWGWPALGLLLATVTSALLFESFALHLAAKPVRRTLFDGSALLTALLLVMTLPPYAPWWIGVMGSFFAIIVAKQLFGGLGQNLFNPAMVARVALLIAFPLEMTTFYAPTPIFSATTPSLLEGLAITFGIGTPPALDAMSSATLLGHVKTELGRLVPIEEALTPMATLGELLLGRHAGSLGETSELLLLLGGGWLLYRRLISWMIPVAILTTLAALATLFHLLDSSHYLSPFYHLFSGATLLTAFFIATDPVTSPATRRGQLLFGMGVGGLIFIIRSWANYPEGAAFAILLMNGVTPLIDHYLKPRIYGRDRHGEPIRTTEPPESTR